jgi:transposase
MGDQKKKRHNKVTFKPYDQSQMWLLPPSLGELIPSNHLSRLVNAAIDGLDLEPILNTYEGGGSSTYHPRMLLKALVYGYVEQIYSSRKIEKALKENICFMWLCGMQQPDHNTLNRFRQGPVKKYGQGCVCPSVVAAH